MNVFSEVPVWMKWMSSSPGLHAGYAHPTASPRVAHPPIAQIAAALTASVRKSRLFCRLNIAFSFEIACAELYHIFIMDGVPVMLHDVPYISNRRMKSGEITE
jgi:hypothetical protein